MAPCASSTNKNDYEWHGDGGEVQYCGRDRQFGQRNGRGSSDTGAYVCGNLMNDGAKVTNNGEGSIFQCHNWKIICYPHEEKNENSPFLQYIPLKSNH